MAYNVETEFIVNGDWLGTPDQRRERPKMDAELRGIRLDSQRAQNKLSTAQLTIHLRFHGPQGIFPSISRHRRKRLDEIKAIDPDFHAHVLSDDDRYGCARPKDGIMPVKFALNDAAERKQMRSIINEHEMTLNDVKDVIDWLDTYASPGLFQDSIDSTDETSFDEPIEHPASLAELRRKWLPKDRHVEFLTDVQRLFVNCREHHGPSSTGFYMAADLENHVRSKLGPDFEEAHASYDDLGPEKEMRLEKRMKALGSSDPDDGTGTECSAQPTKKVAVTGTAESSSRAGRRMNAMHRGASSQAKPATNTRPTNSSGGSRGTADGVTSLAPNLKSRQAEAPVRSRRIKLSTKKKANSEVVDVSRDVRPSTVGSGPQSFRPATRSSARIKRQSSSSEDEASMSDSHEQRPSKRPRISVTGAPPSSAPTGRSGPGNTEIPPSAPRASHFPVPAWPLSPPAGRLELQAAIDPTSSQPASGAETAVPSSTYLGFARAKINMKAFSRPDLNNRGWIFGYKSLAGYGLYIMRCPNACGSVEGWGSFKKHPLEKRLAANHLEKCGFGFEGEADMVREYGAQLIAGPGETITIDWAREQNNLSQRASAEHKAAFNFPATETSS